MKKTIASDTYLTIRCEHCNKKLTSKTNWLELSKTDNNYYIRIPKGHKSQGFFSFGTGCAAKELNKTFHNLIVKNKLDNIRDIDSSIKTIGGA